MYDAAVLKQTKTYTGRQEINFLTQGHWHDTSCAVPLFRCNSPHLKHTPAPTPAPKSASTPGHAVLVAASVGAGCSVAFIAVVLIAALCSKRKQGAQMKVTTVATQFKTDAPCRIFELVNAERLILVG
jgi:hypothetical protein